MKKAATLLALVLALAIALTACGGGAESGLDPKNPVTLSLWHYYVGENQQAIETSVAEFNQSVGIESGVIVEPVAMGSIAELEEAVTNSSKGVVGADPMPEIFSSYPDKAMEINELGMLCDLGSYFTEEEKQAYVEDFLADGVLGGEFLLVPIVKSTELFYMNDTEWAAFTGESGLDESSLSTWEGVYDASKSYYEWVDAKTPDALWDGKGLMGFDSVANFVIIGNKQQGVDVIDADGQQAVLNSNAMRKIFEIYYNGMSMGYMDAIGNFRSDDIKAGDLAGYVGSSSSAAYFPTWIERDGAESDIELTALSYPVFEGGEQYAIQQGAGMCVASSTPEKQEGAALFLKWFTAKEQNVNFAMTTGYLPVEQEAYQSSEFDAILSELQSGEKELQNVGKVYEIALAQITESNTYAAKPFVGSYDVRSVLQSTLIEAGDAGRQTALELKEQGRTEEEILQAIDVNGAFDGWMQAIKSQLDELEIKYTEQ